MQNGAVPGGEIDKGVVEGFVEEVEVAYDREGWWRWRELGGVFGVGREEECEQEQGEKGDGKDGKDGKEEERHSASQGFLIS